MGKQFTVEVPDAKKSTVEGSDVEGLTVGDPDVEGLTVEGLTVGDPDVEGLTVGGLTVGGLTVGDPDVEGLTVGGLTVGDPNVEGLTVAKPLTVEEPNVEEQSNTEKHIKSEIARIVELCKDKPATLEFFLKYIISNTKMYLNAKELEEHGNPQARRIVDDLRSLSDPRGKTFVPDVREFLQKSDTYKRVPSPKEIETGKKVIPLYIKLAVKSALQDIEPARERIKTKEPGISRWW